MLTSIFFLLRLRLPLAIIRSRFLVIVCNAFSKASAEISTKHLKVILGKNVSNAIAHGAGTNYGYIFYHMSRKNCVNNPIYKVKYFKVSMQ